MLKKITPAAQAGSTGCTGARRRWRRGRAARSTANAANASKSLAKPPRPLGEAAVAEVRAAVDDEPRRLALGVAVDDLQLPHPLADQLAYQALEQLQLRLGVAASGWRSAGR